MEIDQEVSHVEGFQDRGVADRDRSVFQIILHDNWGRELVRYTLKGNNCAMLPMMYICPY